MRPPGARDPPPTRAAIVKRITETGSKAQKIEAGYHRRNLAETAMSCIKTLINSALKSRTLSNQKFEASIGVRRLNRFTALGMPVSAKIG
jgi:hypothetical protein